MKKTLPPEPPLFTLKQLMRATGLARASLLHYETLGLLQPRSRSPAGYRLYGSQEQERALTIRRYRAAGLSLSAIRSLLVAPGETRGGKSAASDLLKARLLGLSDEVERLREQQRRLAQLLTQPAWQGPAALHSKAAWVALLREAGWREADMARWHAEFEVEDPVAHAAFLRALGLGNAEVAAIRRKAKAALP
jgi:MerR family transcriptional regulator, thiopeptide resistance regulator